MSCGAFDAKAHQSAIILLSSREFGILPWILAFLGVPARTDAAGSWIDDRAAPDPVQLGAPLIGERYGSGGLQAVRECVPQPLHLAGSQQIDVAEVALGGEALDLLRRERLCVCQIARQTLLQFSAA